MPPHRFWAGMGNLRRQGLGEHYSPDLLVTLRFNIWIYVNLFGVTWFLFLWICVKKRFTICCVIMALGCSFVVINCPLCPSTRSRWCKYAP